MVAASDPAAAEDGLAVGSSDLGGRAAVGRDQRGPRTHRLDGREAEPLVEARHHGQFRFGVELDDPLVGDSGDELDGLAEAIPLDQIHALAGLGSTDDGQGHHASVSSELGHGLEEVGESLEGHVG